ncbi:general secretion pathway protein G [Parasphingorhabdus marina DSM 22363]|uniref:Type II secretion system core protein G n=1 Tax=Parasphingorhabdus marina DSM 22363 TaxID=1123272 RepID=A0A1N6HLS7_9SPHN|nr:type II secretion system major pseudopilin GspG [Parasphingorhabdus marina]SIO20693.1 general secretion pathway protein G [Parasphingorhabdus marina DSM 22363]
MSLKPPQEQNAAWDPPKRNGFTLMEMLVVLVVIGLIAAVAIPQITNLLGSAKTKAAKVQLDTLSASLRHYELDTGAFPTSEQGIEVLWSMTDPDPAWNGPYVRQERQLKDPWGFDFVYRSPAEDAPYELVTLGADNKEGGTGDDADLKAIP